MHVENMLKQMLKHLSNKNVLHEYQYLKSSIVSCIIFWMKFIWIDVRGAFGLLLPMVSTIFSDNELATPAVTGDVIFGPLQFKKN